MGSSGVEDDDEDDDVSPFPPALASRVPSEHEKDKLSAVLVPRSVGYLVVRVTFHKEPCAGLKVKLYETDDDGNKAAQVGDELKTNQSGVVRVPWLVTAGLYVAAIENQPDTVVTTVADVADAYEVVTPIGRPYVDVDEDEEWPDDEEGKVKEDAPAAADGAGSSS